jgi:hypothetical protein
MTILVFVAWVASGVGAHVRDLPDPSSVEAAAMVNSTMEADVPLDYALF